MGRRDALELAVLLPVNQMLPLVSLAPEAGAEAGAVEEEEEVVVVEARVEIVLAGCCFELGEGC